MKLVKSNHISERAYKAPLLMKLILTSPGSGCLRLYLAVVRRMTALTTSHSCFGNSLQLFAMLILTLILKNITNFEHLSMLVVVVGALNFGRTTPADRSTIDLQFNINNTRYYF